MKTFEKLSDLKKYVELSILGAYGRGFTYNDIKIDLAEVTKRNVAFTYGVFIVVRKTGTQGLFFSKANAVAIANQWSNSDYIINISLIEGKYCVSSCKF